MGRHRPPLAWIWAATGVLVLSVAAMDVYQARIEVDIARARLARADQRLNMLRKTFASVAAGPSKSEGRPDAEAARAARLTTDRLSHPWGRMLLDIESESAPGLQWLLFDHDADAREVRMEGLVANAANALALVDALNARRGWPEVVMTRLDAPGGRAAAGSGPAWHFELRANIDPAALAATRAED